MKLPRCPLCRVSLQVAGDCYECPQCGRSEFVEHVSDVLTVRTPEPFDPRKAFAALRAAVDSIPDKSVPATGRTLHTLPHADSDLPAKTPS